MNDTLTSESVFVGRKREQDVFRGLLSHPDGGAWILNLHGPGGNGKTWLLEKFRQITMEECPEALITRQFIDFYFTTNRHEFGVLRNVAEQLDTTAFPSFWQALEHYEARLGASVPLSPEEQRGLQRDVYDRFAESYRALAAKKRIVLLLDTAEQAGEAGRNLRETVLPRLKGNTVVVIAGREPLLLASPESAISVSVQAFGPRETIDYFRERGFEDSGLPDEAIEIVWQHTGGRPILIALTADWLEHNSVDELLTIPPDEFEPSLIVRVCDLGERENRAIQFMAHVWRRFDRQILAYLTGWSLEIADEVVEKLHGQSFVKYRPPQMGVGESCLLHDEMRDLVKRHIWPRVDRSGELACELSGKMVTYYALELDMVQDWRERQSLACEQTYYHLEHNLDAGFVVSRRLFEEKARANDVAFCEALNTEVERHRSALPEAYRHEHDFRQGWVAFQRERRLDAIALWRNLVADADAPRPLKARAFAYLVEAYADSGELGEAERCGEEAELLYRVLERGATTPGDKEGYKQERGLLYNNLGYMRRRQDRWEDAIGYYNKALDSGGPAWQEARIRNNLGYAHQLLGRSELAFSHCETALRIRKRLTIPYELGLSYNTLGILCVDALRVDEAQANFQRAIGAFEQAHSEHGRAMVYAALGRLYRQWGWHQEQAVEYLHKRERTEYRKAIEYLAEAASIYERVDDEVGLSEALGELGCTYRERREWERALSHLNQALDMVRNRDIRRREADILQDISLTYERQVRFAKEEKDAGRASLALDEGHHLLLRAEEYAEKAARAAEQAGFPYLLSKAQWTLGDIACARGQYERAFAYFADAGINITKLDPTSVGHESAKKKLYYEDLIKHIEEKMVQLPTGVDVELACRVLLDKWEDPQKGLVSKFPGSIERIEAINARYDLLRETAEGASDGQQ